MRDPGSIEIVSRTPRRVRLRVEHPHKVEQALAKLGLSSVKVTALTGSVLLYLKPGESERFQEWLDHGAQIPSGLTTSPVPRSVVADSAGLMGGAKTPSAFSWQFVPGMTLAAACGFSLLSGAFSTASVLGTALVGHAVLGRVVKSAVGHRLQVDRSLLPRVVRMVRGGRRVRRPFDTLAPGDVIEIKRGDVIPADARLLEVDGLITGETVLTGRTRGQLKSAWSPDGEERSWMVYAGTTVMSGKGRAKVTAVGPDTALSKGRGNPFEPRAQAPMASEVARFADRYGRLTLGVGLGLGALAFLSGRGLLHVLPAAAALSLSTLPKGLPAMAASAIMGDLRRRETVVREPQVFQNLGRATVVCLDKTGTLTRKDMWVDTYLVNDRELKRGTLDARIEELLQVGVLCSTARAERCREWVLEGSGTERALLQEALDMGMDVNGLRDLYPLEKVWDRSDGTAHMLSWHTGPEGRLSLLKGAPERLLALCTVEASPEGDQPLSKDRRQVLLDQVAGLASRGLHVFGFARAKGHAPSDRLQEFTWLGLVALENPVRPAVRKALDRLRRAGLKPILLTGDHPETAARLARDLGLGGRVIVNGEDLKVELSQGVPDVLARATTSAKQEFLRELRRRGEVVVMLGHDERDLPVLRNADIGIVHGSRASQLSADVVMLEENLGALSVLVERSRGLVRNMKDSFRFLASSGLADLMLVGATLVLKLPLSMSPAQLLWTHLVTQLVAAFSLATETTPQSTAYASTKAVDEFEDPMAAPALLEAITLAGSTLGSYLWGIARYGKGERARTVAFTTATLCELAYARAQRSHHGKRSTLAMELAGVAQALTVIVPNFRGLLGTRSLRLSDWGVAVAGAATVYVVTRATRRSVKTGRARPQQGRAGDLAIPLGLV